MTPDGTGAAHRRALRMLAFYPAAWRDRYGEEFVQFLIDDMDERPHSAARGLDVVRGGLLARATYAGLSGEVADPDRQLRTGLMVLGLAVAAFLTAGVAVWSQLTIGWQWSAPLAHGTRTGMLVMSATMLAFGLIACGALIPLGFAVLRELIAGDRRKILGPIGLTGIGAAVLIAGSIHFGHGWPGTGGHAWSGRGLVPGVVARFCWAATLWITSYWAHPGALSSFPAVEIGWMLISPLALLSLLSGAVLLFRRVRLSARILTLESWFGVAAALTMAAFLAGAASWVISGGPAPQGLFRVGMIDGVAVALMAGALVLAVQIGRRNLGIHRRLLASG